MNSLYDIVGFYLNLSHFKDSHQKILVISLNNSERQESALSLGQPSLHAKIRPPLIKNPLTSLKPLSLQTQQIHLHAEPLNPQNHSGTALILISRVQESFTHLDV